MFIQFRHNAGTSPDKAPGDAHWIGDPEHPVALGYICPCGCGSYYVVHVADVPGTVNHVWDGNLTAPSIKRIAGRACSWKGALVAGEWVEAGA